MTNPHSDREALSRRALRFADGASRPVLVEELYVDWELDAKYALSFRSTRERVAGWWPEQGVAWEKFGGVITQHVEAGMLVMCSNTDEPNHPEHHLTQGHSQRPGAPFIWGTAPLVLRYIATPAGSIAWRKRLDELEAQRVAAQQASDERRARIPKDVLAAVAGGATTVRAIAATTGCSQAEVQAAVLNLVSEGLLRQDRRTLFGSHRWQVTEQQHG